MLGSIGAIFACSLASCAPAEVEREHGPEMVLHDFVLRHYPEEGPPSIGTAATVSFDRESSVVVAETLSVDLPESPSLPGRGGARLVADRGQGDIHGEGARVEGGVVLETGAGDRVEVEGATWDGVEQRLFDDEGVVAKGPGYALSGGSFNYEHQEQTLHLDDGVHLVSTNPALAPVPGGEESETVDVRSPRMTVEHGKRQATFYGGVVLTRGDLVVRCPSLTATYDATARIRRVVCEGPVEAQEGTRKMTAAEGSFDNREGILSLEGEPEIVDGERKLRGERMIYEVATATARVQRGEALLPSTDAPIAGASSSTNEPLHVEADEIVYDTQTRTTAFAGNVRARKGKVDLEAKRMIAVSGADGGLERAWTEGGPVVASEGARRATAGRASFQGRGQRLVLEDEPLLVEGDSSLRGKRVIFFLGEDRVEVDQPRGVFPLGDAVRGGRP